MVAAHRSHPRVGGRCAGVAQVVEHQLPKLRVAGSSPVSRLFARRKVAPDIELP